MRNKLNLETITDVREFVKTVWELEGEIMLENHNGQFKVNARSIMGALYTLEWDDIWVVSENDIYQKIKQYIA